MPIDKGNSACTSGLSGRIYDLLTSGDSYAADSRLGFSDPLTGDQGNALKGLAWSLAQAIGDQDVPVLVWAQCVDLQPVSHNTTIAVQFSDVQIDNQSAFDGTTFTAPFDGLYKIIGRVMFDFGIRLGEVRCIIEYNGAAAVGEINSNVNGWACAAVESVIWMTSGDEIRILAYQVNNAGAACNVHNDPIYAQVHIARLGDGPS